MRAAKPAEIPSRPEARIASEADRRALAARATAPTEADLRADMPSRWRNKFATEDEAFKQWNAARAHLNERVALGKNFTTTTDENGAITAVPKSKSGTASGEVYAPGQVARYVNPQGKFYKTVLAELKNKVAPDAAEDIAQETALAFQQNIKNGTFTLPTRVEDEGLVMANLKEIANHKVAEWNKSISDKTKSGVSKGIVEGNPRMSLVEGKSAPEIHDSAEESAEDKQRQQSPFGTSSLPAEENSVARSALDRYLKENPTTAKEDQELLLSASARSLEKAEAARRKAYDKEMSRSGSESKARKAGSDAVNRVNSNKFTSTDRYFGLTDEDMAKLGQSQKLTGAEFRQRLTSLMDSLNELSKKSTAGEKPTRPYTGNTSAEQTNLVRAPKVGASAKGGLGRMITAESAPDYSKGAQGVGRINVGAEGPHTRLETKVEPSLILPRYDSEGKPITDSTTGELLRPRTYPAGQTIHGAGNTLPLTTRLPVGDLAPAEAPRISSRAPVIDTAGALKNRQRIGDDLAQQTREARRLVSQYAERNAAADAGKPLPSVSGGSGAPPTETDAQRTYSLNQAANAYMAEHFPNARPAVRRSHIVQQLDSSADAQAFINKQFGKSAVSGVEDVRGGLRPELKAINIGGRSEVAKGPASTSVQSDIVRNEANKFSRQLDPSKQEVGISQLNRLRNRLGLGGSERRVSPEGLKSLGAQEPVTGKNIPTAIKARSGGTQYKATRGSDTTVHEATAHSTDGKQTAIVKAVAENDEPNTWVVRASAADRLGTGAGSTAYAKLADAAQGEATRTGKPVTLKGDASRSPSAEATWNKLARQHGFDVVRDSTGRPSITFKPATKKAVGLGKTAGLT